MNKKIKVIHVMSDGTERDSLEGFVVPRTPETEMFYRMIAGIDDCDVNYSEES